MKDLLASGLLYSGLAIIATIGALCFAYVFLLLALVFIANLV
jgi:hypothetical protein